MKSLIEFSHVLLLDLGKGCGVSTSRDQTTVAARVEAEGVSFLTITLPNYCKDFERSLADGSIADDAFPGFARTRGLPRFLGGFLRLVFDQNTGSLLDSPSTEAVRAIRQFTLAFGKVNSPCSPSRMKKAFDAWVECERDVARWNSENHSSELNRLTATSDILFGQMFSSLDLAIANGELIPKHGPGSTADHILGNKKFHIKGWSERLDAVFPVADWVLPSVRHWEHLDGVDIFEPGDEPPVRVIAVPKTLKTPRIIALEPHYVQYAQQGIKEFVYEWVSRDNLLRSLIGFEDQEPNRHLARLGSIDGTLATLDLSEASDRVSRLHVESLLAHHSLAREAVFACRTSTADVPGHGIVSMSKFASMGSALCFPFEAMVFLTIVLNAVAEVRGTRCDRAFVEQMRDQVRVYGDDIIVPVDCAPRVIDSLEAYGLKVNRRKTFLTGLFRESCGGDYFSGIWVTPVRVKSLFPRSRKHADEIVSTVALRNHLYELGYENSVQYLDRLLGPYLPVWPEVPVGHPSLGRWTYSTVMAERVHPDLQVPLVRVPVARYTIGKDILNGIGGLMKFFLRRGSEPLQRDSFMRAGRPVSARITTRWAPLS